MTEIVDAIANGAGWFVGLFTTAAGTLWGFIQGTIPLLLVFLTFMNTLVLFIGEKRVEKIGSIFSKYAIFRYTLMPIIFCTLIPGTSLFIVAKLLPQHQKPAYADVYLTYLHPSAGFFPHVHASEIWVYMGLANGIAAAGLSTNQFALRAFLVCIPIMLIRGIITERITVILLKRAEAKQAEEDAKLSAGMEGQGAEQ
ncbi:PTS sorbitol transporter subunit IIC [Eubacteriales bacterium OttesenSCG-928-N14]|nr:PTS sorbitol transporter subunit IIC [Eubacteriales bacterium OttesenSCG-928-N14]